ncbi:putative phosphoribosyltransferase [Caulobacter ginsengisoli]|uniref:Phosphoribosyltransferase n=1 Tax=Caulobacter ginsengisoli TaxID=400775 RepID=A0ABU0J0M3_9CAUL|nr:phosphoribosyltransferase [Caulobacter ginsengisoli]MDQ0466978.1 putative phosphoribosyltransferase [Caulobacter ginsengisoli]
MDMSSPLFADRFEAGRWLAERFLASRSETPLVVALPRGGVPVAFEIAKALDAPLDLALVRKIGAPGNPELALAAVSDGTPPLLVVNEAVREMTGADETWLRAGEDRELAEIARRRRLYFGGRARPDPRGRTVLLVDDGLATGATARVAVQALKAQGAARVILAAPVAPPDTAAALRQEADEVVCLAEPEDFRGVGQFYADFHQLSDAEVIDLLDRSERFGGQG